MDAKNITVTTLKGGEGKTTIAVHTAVGLALDGYRVGLVDTDSQGQCSLLLNQPESDGLFNALVEKTPLESCVQLVASDHYTPPRGTAVGVIGGNLYLLPSAASTYRIPHVLGPEDPFVFLDLMESFASEFALQVVIIDTAPSMGWMNTAVYMATDAYLYVATCERLPLDGLMKAVHQSQALSARRAKRLGRTTSTLGILPNKYRARTNVHRENLAHLRDHFGELVWDPIPLATLFPESTSFEKTMFTFAPNAPETKALWNVARKTEEALWAAQSAVTP